MSVLKFLFLPLAWIYHLVTAIRNHLFNIGHFRSFQFETVVLSVGNLNAGGSGKTPMVEYLIRLLAQRYKLVVLSRGYGRKTSGYRLANDLDTAETIGDEPFQLYEKYKHVVRVAVGEERALAIPSLLHECEDIDVIILDDAFQHRTVSPDFSILLSTYSKPFYSDFILPVGRLRESKVGASRANAIVITKCPEKLEEQKIKEIVQRVQLFASAPVFFSNLQYHAPKPFGHSGSVMSRDVVLVSGVANSGPLESFVKSRYSLVKHFNYADHHRYTEEEIRMIQETAKKSGASIVTTAKDRAKLVSSVFQHVLVKDLWFKLPIESAFLSRGSDFDALVLHAIEDKKSKIQSVQVDEQ